MGTAEAKFAILIHQVLGDFISLCLPLVSGTLCLKHVQYDFEWIQCYNLPLCSIKWTSTKIRSWKESPNTWSPEQRWGSRRLFAKKEKNNLIYNSKKQKMLLVFLFFRIVHWNVCFGFHLFWKDGKSMNIHISINHLQYSSFPVHELETEILWIIISCFRLCLDTSALE